MWHFRQSWYVCASSWVCVVLAHALDFVTRGVKKGAKFSIQMTHDVSLTYSVKLDVTASAADVNN